MQDLKVTIVQTDIIWEDIEKNVLELTRKLISHNEKTDLVVLPEMFTTGFSMEPSRLAEKHLGFTFAWMQEMAKVLDATIVGSYIVHDDNRFFNRLYCVSPDGDFDWYDKRHLFRMAGENEHYTSGRRRLIYEVKGWRILPLICYDLRFPVWSANRYDSYYKEYEYDCIVYVANWPVKRRDVWNVLLQARALENISYVVGVNRIGKDGRDIEYTGDSKVLCPKATLLSSIQPEQEGIETITLSAKALQEFREHFPVGLDFDKFSL